MITQLDLTVRAVQPVDRQKLANLVHFEIYVHRHLDWRTPLDWIGQEPYLGLEKGDELMGALACPPDPTSVAWIRLFAVASKISYQRAWSALWPVALEKLSQNGRVEEVSAIPFQSWFLDLLTGAGFRQVNQVVMLQWEGHALPPERILPEISLRPMNLDDLDMVVEVDRAAFRPRWQNSKPCLEVAFRQAAFATVAEIDGQMVGYQISTATALGAHLARLAVLPERQGSGVGYCLVRDLLSQFLRRGVRQITVNTQEDNTASLALYQRTGFQLTGEAYPIYAHPLKEPLLRSSQD